MELKSGRLSLKDVTGISSEQLRGMNKSDLLRVLAPIRDAANKRINRLSGARGVNSPALSAIEKTGGKLYGSKWSTNKELVKEIERGQSFLGYQTSTVKGAREFGSKMTGKIKGKITYGDMNAAQIGEYWNIMHKMQEAGIQLSGENYDIVKSLIRTSVSSEDPGQEFLNSLPAEAHDYILEHSVQSDDPVDTVVSMIGAYVDYQIEGGDYYEDEEDEEEGSDWFFL